MTDAANCESLFQIDTSYLETQLKKHKKKDLQDPEAASRLSRENLSNQANLPSDNQTVHDYTTPEPTKSVTSIN
jgi:hypothetical protein